MTVKRGGRGFGHTCRVSGHAGDGAAGVTVPTVSGFLLENKLSSFFKDTARTTPCTADGDLIAAWADTSGQGHHFTQATSGNRPTLKQDAGTGKWYALFSGAQYLDCAAYQVTNASTGACSLGFSGQVSTTNANRQIINSDTGTAGTRGSGLLFLNTALPRMVVESGTTTTSDTGPTYTANTNLYITGVADGSTAEVWLNGSSDGSSVAASASRSVAVRLGAILSSAGQALSGRIYGAVSDNTAISSGTRATWETWLASLYA